MDQQTFKSIQQSLPTAPGIYKFIDKENKLLYVGKAKNIRKRVSSYFINKYDSGKTRLLVKKTKNIDFTIVDTEQDALLLENLLIKEHQPRYNIQLRDDKTYPHICIKNERFPRIFLTRNLIDDGSEYLGPYTSVKKVRALIRLLQNLFPLRTCSLNLSEKNIEKGNYKVCLEYHIGNCLGPCENLQTEVNYDNNIQHIRSILKGHVREVIKSFSEEMKAYAFNLDFEKADKIKSKIDLLKAYQSDSGVVHHSINNVDVFTLLNEEKYAYVNYLKVVNGGIVQAKTVELQKKLEETPEELLTFAITALRKDLKSNSSTLILPFKLDFPNKNVKIIVPQRGEKKKLLDLSFSNAAYHLTRKKEKLSLKKTIPIALEELQTILRLNVPPIRIECFDNSNFQGSYPVASMVVFKNGKPSKNDYRHFNIKTVEGPDDFASMREVIFRRFQNKANLPQLLVIDGGKGQLNAALDALKKLKLEKQVNVISIAKRLEELYVPNDSVPLHIDKKSPALKLIQQLRNEAHRFAITFHRQKRSKGTVTTNLLHIKGIGKKSSELLLRTFKSEKKIRQASLEELALVVGHSKAQKIFNHYATPNF